ncbi:MAG: right-handed parallel beta-helix repeat-containing protein [Terriglobales bacterium]
MIDVTMAAVIITYPAIVHGAPFVSMQVLFVRFRKLSSVLAMITMLAIALANANAQSSATSGVPRVVKFSGLLGDAASRAVNGVQGITFAIYAAPTGGAPLWQETQNVQLANGRYTVFLGNNTSGGIPAQLFASEEQRWLGVRLVQPGEQERQRTFLTSVPYALKAADADTLGGLPASAYIKADALRAAQAEPPIPAVAQSPDLSRNRYFGGNYNVTTPGGTVGYIPVLSGSNTVVNSHIQDSAGYVTMPSLTTSALNNIVWVDGTKYTTIQQADAALGSAPGTIMVSFTTTTMLVGPFTLRASHALVCYQAGTLTLSGGPITMENYSSIIGQPTGLVYLADSGNCIIQLANKANFAEMIMVSGNDNAIRDVVIDGNAASNPTAGPAVVVTGTRLDFQGIIRHSNSHGIQMGDAKQANIGQANRIHNSVIYNNNGSCVHMDQTVDQFIDFNEFENCGRYGIEAAGADSIRISGNDISGGSLGGIYVTGSAAYASAWWNIINNQFGNNLGPDIQEINLSPQSMSIWGWNIEGNHFNGLGHGAQANAYSPFYARDAGYTAFIGNDITNNGGPTYKYGIDLGQTSGTEQADTVVGNKFYGYPGTGIGTACMNLLPNTQSVANICGAGSGK